MIISVYVDFSNPSNHNVMFMLWFGFRFRHKNYLVSVGKISWIGFEYLFIVATNMSEDVNSLLKNTEFYLHKHA